MKEVPTNEKWFVDIHFKTQKSPQLFLQHGEEKLWGFSIPHSLERERISFVTYCCCGAILGTLTCVPAKEHREFALFLECRHQFIEAVQCGLQIFDDIRGQFVGIGQAV